MENAIKKRRGHDTTEITFPLPLSRSLLTSSQKSRKSTYIIIHRLFVETLARSPIIAIIAIFIIYYEKIFSQSLVGVSWYPSLLNT